MLDKDFIESWLSKKSFVDIEIKDGQLTIQKRPPYCDRGNYIVNVFVNIDSLDLHIDEADMFPRYYFDLGCLVKEMNLWVMKRKQALQK